MRVLETVLVMLVFTCTLPRAPGEEDLRLDDTIAQAAHLDNSTPSTQTQQPASAEADPFADLDEYPKLQSTSTAEPTDRSWKRKFFTENFGFRKEIMSQFDTSERGQPASRQSVGFEALKKFSTATATIASFNFQGRLVRRDGFHPVLNDMEGESRPDWAFEYHNLYLDLYNVLNPVLSDEQRGANAGRFNVRIEIGRAHV